MDERTRRILEAPLLPTLLSLAGPTLVVMLAQTAVGLMEIYFIARLGVDALAGVSQVFPILALTQAMSQGAIGGGIVGAISRALGRGRTDEASEAAWYALAIAAALGLATTAIVLAAGPWFYASMGAGDAALGIAEKYSATIFGGAVLIWVFNGLMAVVRGTGNVMLTMYVVCGGAIVLLPVSPLLIFGAGPLPGLGVIGGAIAILAYYGCGTILLAAHIWGHRGALKPSRRPPRLRLDPSWRILKVGGLSCLISASTNLTIAIVTGFAAGHGTAALAAYGAGARLEILLVPLSYGIGGAAGILIGTNIGAGQRERALRAAWIAVAIAILVAETIGLTVAIWPGLWIGAFSTDPEVISAGASYLTTTGPFFGFFGAALALYFAAQGAGRIGWPVAGALARAAVAIGGGLLAASIEGLFLAVGLGMMTFAALGSVTLLARIGFRAPKGKS